MTAGTEAFDARFSPETGTELVYSEYPGPPQRCFVLVHGIGMGRSVFAEVASALAAHGRVLALDLPGFGDSPVPARSGSAPSIEQTGDTVAKFIAATTTGPVVLVGHSMGTQVVAETAMRHPALVGSLVLIAPTVNRHERSARMQATRMLQDLAGEGPKVLLRGLYEYARTSPRWFLAELRRMLAHRLEDVCPEIGAPALVLRGGDDRVCPAGWTLEIAKRLRRGRYAEIPRRGHEALIKQADPAASMIGEFARAH